ncbi:DUF4345 domain-containing protein [Neptunomonas japonica]|uniref:DUF4345 domain-containing protein n=1 Tax=Neptunomonas japonica JAMM 1380 TaxID=1441457 RepID=A0A7R6PK52_9GAMM|nr:conserved hypothetical protein [Neptunomonas japonica JAMM 1380]
MVFSFFTICIIGLLYGASPSWFFRSFLLESPPPGVDQSHILRAVMMLYIALGLFWLYCAFSEKYRDAGIVVLCVFCGGLVTGRILSVVIDGIPSPLLVLYVFIELSVVPLCIWLLRRDNQ